jgi:hypothetical protein
MARVAITSGYYGDTTVDHYGSDSASKYIPKLYSKKVLKQFYANSFYNDICNTDYEGEIKNAGDQVIIRRTPTLTVNPYTIGLPITYEVPKADNTFLTIDKANYVAFRVDDIDKAQSDIGLINMFADDASERLRIATDTDILGYMSTGADASNVGATAGALSANINLGVVGTSGIAITSTNAVDYIVYMNQVLDEANQSSEGRFLVLPAWYCALLKLGDLRRADVSGDGTGVIRSGLIGQVDRTMIYQSNNLTHETLSGNECFYAVAGTKEATSFAMQVSKTDTLQIPDSFGEYWRTLFVYGRKVVQPTGLTVGSFYKG